jgi:hypothetical protein
MSRDWTLAVQETVGATRYVPLDAGRARRDE